MPELVLHALPPSHPCMTAEAALRLKGLAYERIDFAPGEHTAKMAELYGEGNTTVPGLTIDGEPVHGSRSILERLELLEPEPALYPEASAGAVREAERWGDEELQAIPRRLAWWALLHLSGQQRTEAARLSLQGYRVGLPIGVAARTVLPIAKVAAHYNNATDEAVRADLAAVPDRIDKVDALLSEGVIGGEQLNAADFQIATSVRLLLAYEDLKPYIEGRPAAEHARRVVRDYNAAFPTVFPADWLPSRPAA